MSLHKTAFCCRTQHTAGKNHCQRTIWDSASAQLFISQGNQSHILAKIHSHQQADYENKWGKNSQLHWISDLKPNNIMSQNTHNIKNNRASGINSQDIIKIVCLSFKKTKQNYINIQ